MKPRCLIIIGLLFFGLTSRCWSTDVSTAQRPNVVLIMADELGADWRTIAVETAPISPLYTNTLLVDEDSGLFMPRTGVPDFVADVRGMNRPLSSSTSKVLV